MKISPHFFKRLSRIFVFAVAFLLVATSLTAFPVLEGKEKAEEKKCEQWENRQGSIGERMDATSLAEEEVTFQKADGQLKVWMEDKSSVNDQELDSFIKLWEEKTKEYEAYVASHCQPGEKSPDDPVLQKAWENFNKSKQLFEVATGLKETSEAIFPFEKARLATRAEETQLQDQEILRQTPHSEVVPPRAGGEVPAQLRNARNNSWANFFSMLKKVIIGGFIAFEGHRIINKHIPNNLNFYCPYYSNIEWSSHPCYGFPSQEKLDRLTSFQQSMDKLIISRFPLIESVGLTEGKGWVMIPDNNNTWKVNNLFDDVYLFPDEIKLATSLEHYGNLKSKIEREIVEFLISNLGAMPSQKVGYYASRARENFLMKVNNLKNLHIASRLSADAKEQAMMAIVARSARKSIEANSTHVAKMEGGSKISYQSEELQKALEAEHDQHQDAMKTWKEAKAAYEKGLPEAPDYSKREWFSKKDWENYLKDITYRMIVLQYRQSETMQKMIENNLGKPYAHDEALTSFKEAIHMCHELANTVIRDASSPYRINQIQKWNLILQGEAICLVTTQQITLLCQRFEEALQKNQELLDKQKLARSPSS